MGMTQIKASLNVTKEDTRQQKKSQNFSETFFVDQPGLEPGTSRL